MLFGSSKVGLLEADDVLGFDAVVQERGDEGLTLARVSIRSVVGETVDVV